MADGELPHCNESWKRHRIKFDLLRAMQSIGKSDRSREHCCPVISNPPSSVEKSAVAVKCKNRFLSSFEMTGVIFLVWCQWFQGEWRNPGSTIRHLMPIDLAIRPNLHRHYLMPANVHFNHDASRARFRRDRTGAQVNDDEPSAASSGVTSTARIPPFVTPTPQRTIHQYFQRNDLCAQFTHING